jgi:hypothetical protein
MSVEGKVRSLARRRGVKALAQGQEFGGAGDAARGRGGLGALTTAGTRRPANETYDAGYRWTLTAASRITS